MTSSQYLQALSSVFEENQNPTQAFAMEQYLKNKFAFYGIKSPERRALQKPFLAKNRLPETNDLPTIVRELWHKEQREYQYFAIDLLKKYLRHAEPSFISLYEEMIVQKSWWDTVDLIASTLVGDLFRRFPDFLPDKPNSWTASSNMWLQRTAIIFQLKYRENTDFDLLKTYIIRGANSKEFFIKKAIGWALREYAKTNPEAVKYFLQSQPLAKLSYREASKYL